LSPSRRDTVVELGSTEYRSVPDAVPDPPDVTWIQLGSDVVSYAHPVGVVTAIEPGPPAAEADALYGLSPTVQATPACVTLSVFPAIVADIVTAERPGFGGMVTVTSPLLVPLAGVAPRPVAVHEHDDSDGVTVIPAVPPAAETVSFDGLIANEQALPNCVTECVWPLTLKFNVRALVPAFGTTV
jgi:hypothetical protein